MKQETIKFIGIFFVILIILNFLLFIFSKISTTVFWVVIVVCAIFAYKGLPALRTNVDK